MSKEVRLAARGEEKLEREVVVLMSDMVRYSRATAQMRPEGVRDFILGYHRTIQDIVDTESFQPVEIEPLAGDGALMVFDKRPGGDRQEVCSRAVQAAMALSAAMDEKRLARTRMGLYLGDIIEAGMGQRTLKFGAGFAVAARLEELCDYFGTDFLFDREVADCQNCENDALVTVGVLTLGSFSSPLNIFTIYKPGINRIPLDADRQLLNRFIEVKNRALDYFCGYRTSGTLPDFPKARDLLSEAQALFFSLSGREDTSTNRVLEYIRENPLPGKDFLDSGMQLSKKNRETLGARLFHLSSELLKAMNEEFYHALVVDTEWEKAFKLEWRRKGETIIAINDSPDGVYFIDSGEVTTINEKGEEIAVLSAGTIFGEMAYFSEEKRRTATVVAKTDVAIRRIMSKDFEKLPVIKKIFERISQGRR